MKFTGKITIIALVALALSTALSFADMPPQPADDAVSSYTMPQASSSAEPTQTAAGDSTAGEQQPIAKDIALSDMPVSLPNLTRYHEISGKYPSLDGLMHQFVPPTNDMKAFYLEDGDFAQWRAHPEKGFRKYIMVQSLAHDVSLPDADAFETVKKEVKKGLEPDGGSNEAGQQVLDKAAGYLRENYDPSAQLKIGETRIVGVPVDNDTTLSLLVLANYAMRTAQGTQGFPMVMSLNVFNIKGHVLFVFAYNSYTTGADIDYVNNVATEFRQKLFALNGMQDAPVQQVSYSNAKPLPDANAAANSLLDEDKDAGTGSGLFRWLNMAIIGVAGLLLLIVLVAVFGNKGKLRDIILGRKDDII